MIQRARELCVLASRSLSFPICEVSVLTGLLYKVVCKPIPEGLGLRQTCPAFQELSAQSKGRTLMKGAQKVASDDPSFTALGTI